MKNNRNDSEYYDNSDRHSHHRGSSQPQLPPPPTPTKKISSSRMMTKLFGGIIPPSPKQSQQEGQRRIMENNKDNNKTVINIMLSSKKEERTTATNIKTSKKIRKSRSTSCLLDGYEDLEDDEGSYDSWMDETKYPSFDDRSMKSIATATTATTTASPGKKKKNVGKFSSSSSSSLTKKEYEHSQSSSNLQDLLLKEDLPSSRKSSTKHGWKICKPPSNRNLQDLLLLKDSSGRKSSKHNGSKKVCKPPSFYDEQQDSAKMPQMIKQQQQESSSNNKSSSTKHHGKSKMIGGKPPLVVSKQKKRATTKSSSKKEYKEEEEEEDNTMLRMQQEEEEQQHPIPDQPPFVFDRSESTSSRQQPCTSSLSYDDLDSSNKKKSKARKRKCLRKVSSTGNLLLSAAQEQEQEQEQHESPLPKLLQQQQQQQQQQKPSSDDDDNVSSSPTKKSVRKNILRRAWSFGNLISHHEKQEEKEEKVKGMKNNNNVVTTTAVTSSSSTTIICDLTNNNKGNNEGEESSRSSMKKSKFKERRSRMNSLRKSKSLGNLLLAPEDDLLQGKVEILADDDDDERRRQTPIKGNNKDVVLTRRNAKPTGNQLLLVDDGESSSAELEEEKVVQHSPKKKKKKKKSSKKGGGKSTKSTTKSNTNNKRDHLRKKEKSNSTGNLLPIIKSQEEELDPDLFLTMEKERKLLESPKKKKKKKKASKKNVIRKANSTGNLLQIESGDDDFFVIEEKKHLTLENASVLTPPPRPSSDTTDLLGVGCGSNNISLEARVLDSLLRVAEVSERSVTRERATAALRRNLLLKKAMTMSSTTVDDQQLPPQKQEEQENISVASSTIQGSHFSSCRSYSNDNSGKEERLEEKVVDSLLKVAELSSNSDTRGKATALLSTLLQKQSSTQTIATAMTCRSPTSSSWETSKRAYGRFEYTDTHDGSTTTSTIQQESSVTRDGVRSRSSGLQDNNDIVSPYLDLVSQVPPQEGKQDVLALQVGEHSQAKNDSHIIKDIPKYGSVQTREHNITQNCAKASPDSGCNSFEEEEEEEEEEGEGDTALSSPVVRTGGMKSPFATTPCSIKHERMLAYFASSSPIDAAASDFSFHSTNRFDAFGSERTSQGPSNGDDFAVLAFPKELENLRHNNLQDRRTAAEIQLSLDDISTKEEKAITDSPFDYFETTPEDDEKHIVPEDPVNDGMASEASEEITDCPFNDFEAWPEDDDEDLLILQEEPVNEGMALEAPAEISVCSFNDVVTWPEDDDEDKQATKADNRFDVELEAIQVQIEEPEVEQQLRSALPTHNWEESEQLVVETFESEEMKPKKQRAEAEDTTQSTERRFEETNKCNTDVSAVFAGETSYDADLVDDFDSPEDGRNKKFQNEETDVELQQRSLPIDDIMASKNLKIVMLPKKQHEKAEESTQPMERRFEETNKSNTYASAAFSSFETSSRSIDNDNSDETRIEESPTLGVVEASNDSEVGSETSNEADFLDDCDSPAVEVSPALDSVEASNDGEVGSENSNEADFVDDCESPAEDIAQEAVVSPTKEDKWKKWNQRETISNDNNSSDETRNEVSSSLGVVDSEAGIAEASNDSEVGSCDSPPTEDQIAAVVEASRNGGEKGEGTDICTSTPLEEGNSRNIETPPAIVCLATSNVDDYDSPAEENKKSKDTEKTASMDTSNDDGADGYNSPREKENMLKSNKNIEKVSTSLSQKVVVESPKVIASPKASKWENMLKKRRESKKQLLDSQRKEKPLSTTLQQQEHHHTPNKVPENIEEECDQSKIKQNTSHEERPKMQQSQMTDEVVVEPPPPITTKTITDKTKVEEQPPQIPISIELESDHMSIAQQFLHNLEQETMELDAVIKDLDEYHQLTAPSVKWNEEITRSRNTIDIPDRLESLLL